MTSPTEAAPADTKPGTDSRTLSEPRAEALGEIALSLSGGGYRAAAFHLGVIDMLHRLCILQEVRVLSTVSGGTFTGMGYAVSVSEGEPFERFYERVYNFLRDTHVIRQALGNLNRGDNTAPKAMPSLIRSAAHIYASDSLFGDRRFDALLNTEGTSHLKDIIFNSTEFRHGVSFRFQTSRGSSGIVGNGRLIVTNDVAADIRLADIAAASSCFPSAFEPMRFPDDFKWPDRRTLDEARSGLREFFQSECVPLMDGGIFDNQGIDSVVKVYKRSWNVDEKKPDLFIISDTNQRSEALLKFPPERRRGWLSLGSITQLAWVLFALALVTSASLLYYGARTLLSSTFDPWSWTFTFAAPFLFAVSIVAALVWLRGRLRESLLTAQEKTDIGLWPYVKRLKVPELISLVDGRIKSLIVLSSSVFLKRIRDLGYEDINVYSKYRGKLCPNLIYDLDDEVRYGREVRENGLEPSPALRKLARDAEGVQTNLWFTDEKTLGTLVACGQATTCFNILRFLLKAKEDQEAKDSRAASLTDPDSALHRVYEAAVKIWAQLNEDERSLLKRR